jgi:hypothetical protein
MYNSNAEYSFSKRIQTTMTRNLPVGTVACGWVGLRGLVPAAAFCQSVSFQRVKAPVRGLRSTLSSQCLL